MGTLLSAGQGCKIAHSIGRSHHAGCVCYWQSTHIAMLTCIPHIQLVRVVLAAALQPSGGHVIQVAPTGHDTAASFELLELLIHGT